MSDNYSKREIENYSKREIDLIVKGVTDHIDSTNCNQDQKLNAIEALAEATLEQAKRTNGRVNKLEGWRSFLVGGWIVVSGFVIPLMTYIAFSEKDHMQERIIHNQEEINKTQQEIKNLINQK